MKLKYYLRGLGVGIVITAFIMSIVGANKAERMTTAKIIQKASELGMVSGEDYNLTKTDLSNAKKRIDDLQKQIEGSGDVQNNQETNKDNQSNENKEEASEQDKTDENMDNPNDNVTTQETFIDGSTSESTTVRFNITQGMSSENVANLLQEKGIIPDAADFINYIVETGNADYLQIGEYEVNTGESYDTIISKITGR